MEDVADEGEEGEGEPSAVSRKGFWSLRGL